MNLHTKEIFDKAYGDRDWELYRDIIVDCILYGEPGPVLDLGAGLGFFVEGCNRYGIKCIGLEGSEYAVEEAKSRFPMEIRQHYLEQRFPFEDNYFSVVVCNQTIEHITRETAKCMLRECYRVLQRGGLLIIKSPCFYDKIQREEETHINLYTPSSLKKEVTSAGFNRIESVNSLRPVLGGNRVAKFITRLAYKLYPQDFLCSTANCRAYKD